MAAIPYLNTVVSPSGGTNAFTGTGQKYHFILSEFGAAASLTLILTDNLTGLQTQIGAGDITGIIPVSLLPFNNKLYALADKAYFCALANAATWNDPNGAGNGNISMVNYSGFPDVLKAAVPYQGNLAFAFRRTVQVWVTDPDPANYRKIQDLPNIGTFAPLSFQAVGDMDAYLLADNGVRSIRVRDASNNASIADVGTPIDAILQPLIASLTDAQKATACGIIEPSSNRYWVYVPLPDGSAGKIYVFSYFPSGQIAAWGTYAPTYQVAIEAPATDYTASVVTYTGLTVGKRYAWLPGAHEVSITNGSQVLLKEGAFTATATTATVAGSGAAVTFTGALSLTMDFVPTKFCVYLGQVWARAGNILLQYGGTDNVSYDNCGVTFVTPYIDGGAPATSKQFQSIDSAFQGNWQISASADYTAAQYKVIYDNNASSYLYKAIGWQATGTHYSVQGVEASNAYALFSSVSIHQRVGNEK